MPRIKRGLTGWSMATVVLIGLAVVSAGLASAGIPKKFNYQGLLTHGTSGTPLPGQHDLTFRVYDDPTGGSLLWTESQTAIADSAGVFSAILGSTTPVDVSFDGPVWLEVEVAGEILLPRREIVSVPFAFTAREADHAARTDSLGAYVSGDFVHQGEAGVVTSEMILDGTGSGLDADMVDGLHADAFAGSVCSPSEKSGHTGVVTTNQPPAAE